MSHHDDLFQELGRTLDVAPSRSFADGVRVRIVRRRLVMRSTMAGMAIAASLLLAVIATRPEPAQPDVMTATAPLNAPAVRAAADVASPIVGAPTVRAAVEPSTRTPQPRRASRVTPVAEPDRLLVVTDQMAVLQAIWAGHRVTAGETEAPPVEVTAIESTPVVVEPVRVLPVVIVDQRMPIEGLPIIRRAVAALETKWDCR